LKEFFSIGGFAMKNTKKTRYHIYLFAIVIISTAWVTVAAAADPAELDEASIQAYLEKKAISDPGSCLVENQKVEIVGIADVVPDHQTEVFYKYEYLLRCDCSKDAKSGQGVLKAVRLRDGKWIDRETLAQISK
jgi:hypothetical protein